MRQVCGDFPTRTKGSAKLLLVSLKHKVPYSDLVLLYINSLHISLWVCALVLKNILQNSFLETNWQQTHGDIGHFAAGVYKFIVTLEHTRTQELYNSKETPKGSFVFICSLLKRQTKRAGVIQPGTEKALGRPYRTSQYLKQLRRKLERDFSHGCVVIV